MQCKELDNTAVDAHLWVNQRDDVLFVVKVVVSPNPVQRRPNNLHNALW